MGNGFFRKITEKVKSGGRNELISGSLWAFGFRIPGILFSYLLLFIISYYYDAAVLGVFTLTLTIIQITGTVGRLGLDTGLLRYISGFRAQNKWQALAATYKKGIATAIIFTIFLVMILYFPSEWIAKHFFGSNDLAGYLKIGLPATVFASILFINSESIRALKKIRQYVFFKQIGLNMLAFLLVAIGFLFYKGKELPVIAYLTAMVIMAGVSFYYWKQLSRPPEISTEKEGPPGIKAMLSVSFPMLLASSLFFVINWTDTLMLGYLSTEANVGIYNVAYRIAAVTSIASFAVNSIAVPKISEAFSTKDFDSLEKTVKNSTFMIFWSSVPIVAIILLFPDFLLGLFGEEFTAGTYALLLIMAGQFISAFSGCVGQVLQMTGHQRVFQNIVFFACILNILLNYILIPQFGIVGAAIASMASIGFWNIASVIFIKYKFGFWSVNIFSRR